MAETEIIDSEQNIDVVDDKNPQKNVIDTRKPQNNKKAKTNSSSQSTKEKPKKSRKKPSASSPKDTALLSKNENLNEADIAMITRASRIKYHPPLSYRWLKIFGLLTLVLPFLMLRLSASFPDLGEKLSPIVGDVANALSLPLIIFAAYIIILKSNERGKLLLNYAIMAVGIYLMLVLIFERYFVTLLSVIFEDMETADIRELANDMALSIKIFQYNIFIDLLLCASFFYFTNQTPKRFANNKKKMLAFRLCALIPVLYVIAAMILSGLMHSGVLNMSVTSVGLLTCRSPATYLMFFSISLYLANAKKIYIRKGGTEEGFVEYKKTGVHSLQFSSACSVIIVFACLFDFLFGLIPGSSSFGIGESSFMFVIIPFIMLISYTKEHKDKTIDLLLPFVAISAIVILLLDTVFTVVVS